MLWNVGTWKFAGENWEKRDVFRTDTYTYAKPRGLFDVAKGLGASNCYDNYICSN